jgi:hypothetical protein
MHVSGRILRTWMPAIHAGMTKLSILCSVGERKIMTHFVVTRYFLIDSAIWNRQKICASRENSQP